MSATTAMPVLEKVCEETTKWVSSHPITFDEFLDLFGPKDYVELIDGVVVEKSMVQLDHERLYGWLYWVLGGYVEQRGLGILLGSRTPVEINQFRGRMPDLLFVRQERINIVQQKGTYGAPDLVIEIISPGDRRSDIIALETDYRAIGVEEIVFIDQRKRRVRVLRKQDGSYVEEIVTDGTLILETLGELRLETEWLFTDPPPDRLKTLNLLLNR